ncbi:MAG: agmatinase family protein [Longimicrobiales bacterium]
MRVRHVLAATLLVAFATTAFAVVDDTPEGDEAAPAPKGATPVIPLNVDDPTYDLWRKRRNDLSKGREPGPIDIQRYPGGMAWQGIPTFFRLPVALLPADLRAGEVDVAIISAHTDMGTGTRGTSRGPNDLRANGDVYGTWGAYSMPHMGTMINPFEELTVVDYGDAPTDPFSTERTMQGVREIVREVAAVKHEDGRHVIPFIVGGDHSLSYPNLAAMADVYGKGNVGVVHFDAHYDGTLYMGHLINHGGWVKRLIQEGHVPGKNYIQVALRGYYPDLETFRWMRKERFRYHPMAEIEKRGWDAVMEDVILEAKDGPEYMYVSFDIDTIDPGFAPGTGTPEPGGLNPREVFPIVRRLCAETNVVGFDLVEYAPDRDPGYVTGLIANRLLRECLTGIAMRKKGITDEHYLSPLTTDDGRK